MPLLLKTFLKKGFCLLSFAASSTLVQFYILPYSITLSSPVMPGLVEFSENRTLHKSTAYVQEAGMGEAEQKSEDLGLSLLSSEFLPPQGLHLPPGFRERKKIRHFLFYLSFIY